MALTNTTAIQTLDVNDPNLFRFFFVLAFADPSTQRPAIDQTTGKESATSFWDPSNGKGSIVAPAAQRPKTYFVAGVCLKLKDPSQIDLAEVGAALQQIVTQNNLTKDCLKNPTQECLGSSVKDAVTVLLTALIDQNPTIAWVAPFCLLGDNGETSGAPAAEAVPEAPAFTG